jgi:hypothetical protein
MGKTEEFAYRCKSCGAYVNFLLPLDGRDACPVCHSFDVKSCPVCRSFEAKSGRHGIAPNIDERIDRAGGRVPEKEEPPPDGREEEQRRSTL